MRTTVDLDDALLAAARRQAAENGTTLTAFIEAALAAALAPRHQQGKPYRLRWRSHKGKLLPGVDINDRDSLLDAMEGRR
jgi:hypothetical protein